jgi:hypothetical protein
MTTTTRGIACSLFLIALLAVTQAMGQETEQVPETIQEAAQEIEQEAEPKQVLAQDQTKPAQASKKPGKNFPDGISPSNVYGAVELASRLVDVLLEAQGIEIPATYECGESGLGPFHVYQINLACIERLHAFQRSKEMRPIPIVISTPMKYTPADVIKLPEAMLLELANVAVALDVEGLPTERIELSRKTPTHVFEITLELFNKLSLLSGQERITPSEVFAQISRAVADGESILRQVDPACRYRVDAPTSEVGRKPSDVYAQCLEVRREINRLREYLGISTTPVPETSDTSNLQPFDVFVQTQIIIAELNLLKINTNTISSTPLAIPVTGKTPTDVHQQATLLQYLLPQIRTLRSLVASS